MWFHRCSSAPDPGFLLPISRKECLNTLPASARFGRSKSGTCVRLSIQLDTSILSLTQGGNIYTTYLFYFFLREESVALTLIYWPIGKNRFALMMIVVVLRSCFPLSAICVGLNRYVVLVHSHMCELLGIEGKSERPSHWPLLTAEEKSRRSK